MQDLVWRGRYLDIWICMHAAHAQALKHIKAHHERLNLVACCGYVKDVLCDFAKLAALERGPAVYLAS